MTVVELSNSNIYFSSMEFRGIVRIYYFPSVQGEAANVWGFNRVNIKYAGVLKGTVKEK